MSVKDRVNQHIVHQPRNSAETEMVRAGKLASDLAQAKEKPAFINIEKDGKETVVENHQPKRSLEFNTAGFYYLSDAAKYLCTHYKDALDIRNKLYVMAELDRETFFDITIGKFTDQYHKFMNALSNIGDRKCYIPIPNGKGAYYIMSPFMLAFETVNQEKLTENERRRLKNIARRDEVARKIEKIYFYFAKPLFEEYLTGANRQYFKYPKNFFAKINDCIKNEMPLVKDTIGANIPEHVPNIYRFVDYLYLHGAGDPNKKQLTLDINDMCINVAPQYAQRDDQGEIRLRNINVFLDLLSTLVILCSKVDGLDYKIIHPLKFNYETHEITFNLEHPNVTKKQAFLPREK
jgi:hypothetical protein